MTGHLYKTTTYAGSIDPAFLFADGVRMANVWQAQRAGIERSEMLRLVEAAKSPTRERQREIAREVWDVEKNAQATRCPPAPLTLAALSDGPVSMLRDREHASVVLDAAREAETHATGTKTIIQYREWAQEWRIRTQVDTTTGSAPPEQAGPRESFLLSDAGARKIADSCAFMAAARGGFKTFVTGTFDAETRADIDAGKTTIQREVTRTMDALTKMYQRGWQHADGREVAGSGEPLAYCWVVEIPKNADGEENPHVHMLLDWAVEFADFKAWAARIEKIWGNGYFHLEKIDDPECAGAYMAKAAGYLTKAAGQSDQGRVKGNRYAISKNARAPAWQTIGTYQLGIMGTLIREVYERIQHKAGELFLQRHRQRAERDALRDRKKQADGAAAKSLGERLTKIGAALIATRKKINAMPIRATKYQLIIKNADYFERFLAWANDHGWGWQARPDSHGHARMMARIFSYKKRRAAWGENTLADYIDTVRDRIADAWQAYHNFENQGAIAA